MECRWGFGFNKAHYATMKYAHGCISDIKNGGRISWVESRKLSKKARVVLFQLGL
jgi:hypothetical protein